ncbi:MAG: hypothetical protein GXO71_02590 [Caldiserica bacterium]|nr:hypothetical protein [Caldisericota bacterium]
MKIKGHLLLFLALIFVIVLITIKYVIKEELQAKVDLSRVNYVVCLGDSLTSGVGASAGENYPSQLSKILNIKIKNAGIAGDTTSLALRRLDEDVIYKNPDLVIILLGGNDFIHRVPLNETRKNIDAIVERLKKQGIMVILVSPIGYYDKVYREVARKHRVIFIPHVLRGVLYNPDLMSDEIHPNSRGYKIIAERIASVFKR